MRILLRLSAVAAVNALIERERTERDRPEHGASLIPISRTHSGNIAWTSGLSRIPETRPVVDHPLPVTTHTPNSAVAITHSVTVSASTVYLTSIVTRVEVVDHTCPAPIPALKSITVEQSRTTTSHAWQGKNTTTSPSPPACHTSGTNSTPNVAICGGRSCGIDFEKGALVHWELLNNRTPLVTHYLHSTCVAVVCNTTEFSRYYSRSATSCDLPPCPSNSLNCECNIVVGPIRLPDGRMTSVTQTGPSGWNLNLGPAATARNIGTCGSTGARCLDAVTTTLFTPLVYTGDVEVLRRTSSSRASPYRNDTRASATGFRLPQLQIYFPEDDILGMCTTVTLSTPTKTTGIYQRDEIATVGGDGITTWPGAETLTEAVAKRGVVVKQSLLSTTTALPICSSDHVLSTTTTVTATLFHTGTTTTPLQTQTTSAAMGKRLQQWTTYLLPVMLLIGSSDFL